MATPVGTSAIGLDEAILRVHDAGGRVVGAGFLVGARQVLTCAHVVARALGDPEGQPPSPGAEVSLDFPLVAPGQALTARIVVWQPPQADNTGDVAGLELTDPPPSGAKAARLVTADDLWAHPFRTFGFPARHDDGVWTSGRLLGRQATGWIQLEDVKETGFRVEPGFSGAPVWDDELHGVVGMAVAAEARPEVRGAYLTPASVLISAWPTLQAQALPACPYRGLFAFREQDSTVYFGREELTDRLVDQLTQSPLAAVVGPSGSGKSSLVFAGAVPRVRQRAGWAVASLRPVREASPVAALAAALLPLLEPDMTEADRLGELPKLAVVLADGRLAEVVDRALDRVGAHRLLLIVDQFEELYTQRAATARQFVDLLVQAVAVQQQRREVALTVALTLRADFLGQALEHAGLAQALQGSVVLIGRMSREQLRQAIEGPVGHEARYEAGLVDRILDDVGAEPGTLPLLEFALTLLWERQVERTLTHAAYEALGGVEGALARYAEQVYLDELPKPEQEAARRVFVQLVRPGEATEPTRRVARRTDLDEGRWQLAQRLAVTRLVVTGRDAAGEETVEVVHEALISGWDRLREWVTADHAFRVWQERLRAAVDQWETSRRDSGALLRGVPLAEAERWLNQRPDELSPAEQLFIRTSRAFQGRALRRLRSLAAGLAALMVIALIVGTLAVQRGRRADAQSRLATSQYLVAQAEDRLGSQPDLSILLSAAAFQVDDTLEAQGSVLSQADSRRDAHSLLAGHGDQVTSVAYSPDGNILASASADDTVILWDVARRTRIGTPLTGHREHVNTVAFSPDGNILASGSLDGTVILWDVARRTRIGTPLTGHKGSVAAVAFSPDGHTLASGEIESDPDKQRIFLWNVKRRARLDTIEKIGTASLAFSRDGRILASAPDLSMSSGPSEVSLWDVSRRRWLSPISLGGTEVGGNVNVESLAFSPDGRTLALATDNSEVVLWHVARHAKIATFTSPSFASSSGNVVAFSPDGKVLAARSGEHNTIYLYDVEQQLPLGALVGHRGFIHDIAFSPDGRTLAVGGTDNAIVLLDTARAGGLFGHTDRVTSVAFSPDGRTLASGGNDKTITLWDVAGRRLLGPPLKGHTDRVTSVAFSPDGRTLASGGIDKKVILWDVAQRAALGVPLTGHTNEVNSVAFSPTNSGVLASASSDKTVILWDAAQRTRLARLQASEAEGIGSVAFSPDGRTLAAASRDITLWDVARRIRVATLLAGSTYLGSVAFSPDGRILAAASRGGIGLWDVAGRAQLATLTGVGNVAFSPDGRTLAAGGIPPQLSSSSGETINLWDVNRRIRYATFLGDPVGGESQLAFSPDGQTLASAGGAVALRHLEPTSRLNHLCSIVGRNLTRAEWNELRLAPKYRRTCG